MDVDKMFKLPALPASAGQKRKFTDAPSPGRPRRAQNHHLDMLTFSFHLRYAQKVSSRRARAFYAPSAGTSDEREEQSAGRGSLG